MPLSAGTRLGPYEILDRIGAGGMGEVYRARDSRLGRDVAVKVLPDEIAADRDRLRRFEREARAIAALSHPNVVIVHDVGTGAGRPYVVTELLEGETLGERLRKGALPLREAVETAVQVARGLAAAHAKAIAHRDLKPANVFLVRDGRVKILDFGLARVEGLHPEDVTASVTTDPGTRLGTVGYMSPEQIRGGRGDHRSDVFSLGILLFEMASGRHPFRRRTGVETQTAILREDPLALEGLGLPEALERVMLRCVEKRPEDRFNSAHDLALALQSITGALLTPLPPPGAGAPEPDPYPGLRPFTEELRGSFLGREAEVAALWEKLQRRTLLSLIGPSGVGKTSFVRAGLVPARPSGWHCVTATPGRRPLASLGRALVPQLASDVEALQELVGLDDPDVAVRLVGRWRRRHAGVLVVVDQLEELFTLNPPEVQAAFATLLRRLCDEAGANVLLSLRDDFFFACHAHPALAEVFTEVTPLGPLSGDALRRALVEPAGRNGFRFEDEALVDEMCRAVSGERGALPLLAFCAAELWERRDRERRLLTRAACESIGGVAGALAQHAEATLERIGSERQGIVREIFRNLVTAHGTRAACEREELLSVFTKREAAGEVLGILVDARLLTSYEDEGTAYGPSQHRVEIVHESLLTAWPRLVMWQTQDEGGAQLRDQLKQAAHLWEGRGRPDDLLWTGTSLSEYELWRGRYAGALSPLEEDFGRAAGDRARRHRRLVRAAVAGVFIALAGVATAVGISRHQAARSRDLARVEALRAEAGKLMALGRTYLETDPTAALAYAKGSLELFDTREARALALEILWRGPVARILPVERFAKQLRLPQDASPPEGLALSPDGHWLATKTGSNRRVLLFPWDGGPPLVPPRQPEGNTRVADFGPRGDLLVTGGSGESVRLWSIPDLREVRSVELGGRYSWGAGSWGSAVRNGKLFMATQVSEGARRRVVRSLALPDGELKVVGTDHSGEFKDVDPTGTWEAFYRHGALGLRSLDGTHRERVLGEHPVEVLDARFSSTGDVVASVDESGEIRVWSLAKGLLRILHGPKGLSVLPLLDAEGRRVTRAGPNNTVQLWDLTDPPDARPVVFGRPGPSVIVFGAFDPRGRWLATTYGPQTVEFWPLANPYVRALPVESAAASGVAFTSDGLWLATCKMDERVRLSPLRAAAGSARGLVPSDSCVSLTTHPSEGRILVGTTGREVVLFATAGRPSRRSLGRWAPAFAVVALCPVAFDRAGHRAVVAPSNWAAGVMDPALRVLRVWDLPSGRERVHSIAHLTDATWWGFDSMAFAPDGTLYVAGRGGVRRLVLPAESGPITSGELVYAAGKARIDLSHDGRLLLVLGSRKTATTDSFEDLLLLDLARHTSRRITTHGDRLTAGVLDSTGRVLVTADSDGVVRAGPASGGEPHLLLAHKGTVTAVAVSPDGRWIASSSEDAVHLWPVPDVSRPPLHTLPHAEMMARLDALTNLRVVRDASSSTGWTLDVGPFPGWRDVPTW